MLTMPGGYMKELEKLCRRHNVLLICDEVATGFGRTGTLFACEREKIRPDILCLSKGITGGYLPLAATLTSEEVYRAFLGKYEDFKTFFHGHTYTANPLACAAALANLAIFRREQTVRKLQPKIAHLRDELAQLADLPHVGEIRQLGLMTGIELVRDRKTREEFAPEQNIGARVCAACRPLGLIIRPLSNVLVLMPPLSITKPELTRMVAIVRQGLGAVLKTAEK
jgi:adenosylmethionine-8-amino-7-oxononanoate aminotransferase